MYNVYNLITGEVYHTTSKFQRDAYLDSLLMHDDKIISFLFEESWYVTYGGTLHIQYYSTAGTVESTTYKLNKYNAQALIDYLEDKQSQGAIIRKLW